MGDAEVGLEARRDELRRRVYGVPGGADEATVAELLEVERRIADAERAAAEAPRAVPRPATGDAQPDEPPDAEPASRADAPPARRRGVAWAVAGVLAIATALGATAIANLEPAVADPLAVFARPQSADDRSPFLRTHSRDSMRKVGELHGFGFWAYRNGERVVCLTSVRLDDPLDTRGECAGLDRFLGHGITIQYAIENLPFAVWPPEARPGDVLSMTWRGEEPELSWDLVRLPRREW